MHTLWRRMRAYPSAVLLISQLGAVVVYPFLGPSAAGRALLGLASILFLTLAIRAVRATPALTVVAVYLGVPVVVLTVLEGIWPHSTPVVVISSLAHAAFYLYVAYGFLRYLFADLEVTRDEIWAIGATFTVVAWAFGYLIVTIETLRPGSFVPWAGETPFFDALFVSFTTLTSVGASDILPATGAGRALVMIEEFAGVMYLALVVSRLVGLTVQRARHEGDR